MVINGSHCDSVMAWRRGRTARLQPVMICATTGGVMACFIMLSFDAGFGIGPLVGLGLIGWLSAGIGADVWLQLKPTKTADFSSRLQRLPRCNWHVGRSFGIVIFAWRGW